MICRISHTSVTNVLHQPTTEGFYCKKGAFKAAQEPNSTLIKFFSSLKVHRDINSGTFWFHKSIYIASPGLPQVKVHCSRPSGTLKCQHSVNLRLSSERVGYEHLSLWDTRLSNILPLLYVSYVLLFSPRISYHFYYDWSHQVLCAVIYLLVLDVFVFLLSCFFELTKNKINQSGWEGKWLAIWTWQDINNIES